MPTTPAPSSPNTTKLSIPTNTTSFDNVTTEQPLIFLQTAAAQGIAGTFAFAAIVITVHQVLGSFLFLNL